MNTISERIRKIRKNLHITQEMLSEKLKVVKPLITRDMISKYESGVVKPPVEILVKKAELGGVSLRWLILGEDEGREPYEIGEQVRIPVLGEISANFPKEAPSEEEVVGYTLVDKEFAEKRKGRLFAVVVRGHCMSPILGNGDKVIFDIGIEPRNRDIVVARIGNDRYEVRIFFKEKISGVVGHNRIELRPEDEIGYKPIEITPDMGIDVQIVGVVVRAIRDFKR